MDKGKLLARLQRMSEKSLTDRIIIPLARAIPFKRVEKRHGASERGTDVLCTRVDELGETELLAIQVKKLRFSGAATRPGHLHGLLNQLTQMLEERIKLRDGTRRHPARVWFVSPFELDASTLEASFDKYAKTATGTIRVIDGHKLLEMLDVHAPELLAQLGDRRARYAQRVEETLGQLHESAAFRLREKRPISSIYVDLHVSVLTTRVQALLQPVVLGATPTFDGGTAFARKWQRTSDAIDKSFGVAGAEITPTYLPGAATLSERRVSHWIVAPRVKAVRTAVASRVGRELTSLRRFATSKRAAPQALRSLQGLVSEIDTVIPDAFRVNDYQSALHGRARVRVQIQALLDSGLNLQITGDAGAGKTTLLRVLGYHAFKRRKGSMPLYVPLSHRDDDHTIYELALATFKDWGLGSSERSFKNYLNSNESILLLDGVDEAVSKTTTVSEEISDLMSTFRRSRFFIAARPWAAVPPHPRLLSLTALPFNRNQVRAFLKRWFVADPDVSKEIVKHLEKHEDLYKLVGSPLVAAVLAAVRESGGRLPQSLIGVYDERFRLLLHDWDHVKGVARDRFDAADKLYFLRKLSFDLHSKRIRWTSWNDLRECARATIGAVRSSADADDFLRELAQNNNVLYRDRSGEWGLEHLQYQEYLAALEAYHNGSINLATYVEDSRWRPVVRMYAEMSRDISKLIHEAYLEADVSGDGLRLRGSLLEFYVALLQLAPNTEPRARALVETDWSIVAAHREAGLPIAFAVDTEDELRFDNEDEA